MKGLEIFIIITMLIILGAIFYFSNTEDPKAREYERLRKKHGKIKVADREDSKEANKKIDEEENDFEAIKTKE